MERLLKLIGVDDEIRSHLEYVSLDFQREMLFWAGLALLVPVGWYIYHRQRHNLATVPQSLRIALTAARIVILAILVFVLAAPYLKLDQTIDRKPILALVFDQSESMGLDAGPFDSDEESLSAAKAAGYQVSDGKVEPETRKTLNQMSRAKLVREAVQARASEWLKPLAEKYELRAYTMAERTERMPLAGKAIDLPEPRPTGPETRLGDALDTVLDEAAGRQVASVVLFSDGQNTAGRSPTDAARTAAELKAPLFFVPAGSERPVRDVALVDVFAPDLVSVDDTVHVSATLEVRGYLEQAVKVSLFEAGSEQPIDSKDLVLRSTEQQHVDLSFKAKEAGAKTLSVRLQPVAELAEDLKANNSDEVIVRVSDERLRVLYIEGFPRWDFRFLKNAMRRDNGLGGRGLLGGMQAGTAAGGSAAVAPVVGMTSPLAADATKQPDIVLETEIRRHPPGQQAVLPQSLDALAEYHTIILGDASPALLDAEFVELLNKAVRERGVGLIVEAGPHSMPHAFDETLLELLPVKMRPRVAGLEAQAFKPFRLEISPDGAIHEATRLYDEPGRNQNVWSQMPAYYWCASVERPSPAATVLAYNPSIEGRYGKLPLVSHQYAGRGKVLFIGTDSTWLWRQNVGDRFFYKFWGQAIRFVARRETNDVKKKSWVEVRPVRARPGEPAEIELMAFRADGAPRSDEKLSLRVERSGAAPSTVELSADKTLPGRYTGKFTSPEVGSCRFVYEPGGGLDPIDAHLLVKASTEELRRPNVNSQVLGQFARVVQLADVASISGELVGDAKRLQRHREAPLWDNWLTLTVLIVIYSFDVGMRRLAGLS